ncbi:hypothetical protein DPEC_G00030770 [Dallia pectoralis]|uniref:Uncharacterized protein n=1 Tax=Dallia pectoralis TaxID=75939 RepID=A0ACC2HC69_DALPE|nr:hypothetical protein DPEC_G00030770 [Dallia pectoralis]
MAFPCISTGIYGFPNEPAAVIALKTVKSWLKENRNKIDYIIFCVFLENDFKIYTEKIPQVFQDDEDFTKGEENQKEELEEELEEKNIESDFTKGDNKPEETSEMKNNFGEELEEVGESAATENLMKSLEGIPNDAVTPEDGQNDTSNNEIKSGEDQDPAGVISEATAQGQEVDGSQQPQTVSTQPQTVSTQPQTDSTQPQTVSTQPHTVSTQPQTDSTQPQTVSTQPQTVSTQPQTVSTQPQTVSTQPQTVGTQSKDSSIQVE